MPLAPEFVARLDAVIATLEAGGTPEVDYDIVNHLRDKGWATRKNFRDGSWFRWNGPAPINYNGVIVEVGRKTPDEFWD